MQLTNSDIALRKLYAEYLDELALDDNAVRQEAIKKLIEMTVTNEKFDWLLPQLQKLILDIKAEKHITSLVILFSEILRVQGIEPCEAITEFVFNEGMRVEKPQVLRILEALKVHRSKELADVLVEKALAYRSKEETLIMIDYLESLFNYRKINAYLLSNDVYNIYIHLYHMEPNDREIRMRILESNTIDAMQITETVFSYWTEKQRNLDVDFEFQHFAIELLKKCTRLVRRNSIQEHDFMALMKTFTKCVSRNAGFDTIEWMARRGSISEMESEEYETMIRNRL